MSDRTDALRIAPALRWRERHGHTWRSPEGALLAWAVVFDPETTGDANLYICAGSPAHPWLVLLQAEADEESELYAATMGQAIVRSAVDWQHATEVRLEPDLWQTTPNNDLPYRYRLARAPANVRKVHDEVLVAHGFGPPAIFAEDLAIIERAVVDDDQDTVLDRVDGLREFAPDEVILAALSDGARPIVKKLLAS